MFKKQVDNLKTNHRVSFSSALISHDIFWGTQGALSNYVWTSVESAADTKVYSKVLDKSNVRLLQLCITALCSAEALALPHGPCGVQTQGIYVLQDNNFRWLLRLAPTAALTDGASRAEFLAHVAQPYLELPCGLIRGGHLHACG